jgi:hypothetical protein
MWHLSDKRNTFRIFGGETSRKEYDTEVDLRKISGRL